MSRQTREARRKPSLLVTVHDSAVVWHKWQLTPEQRIAALQEEVELQAQVDALEQTCAELWGEVLELLNENARLREVIEGPEGELRSAEQRKPGRPSFVRPNRARREGRICTRGKRRTVDTAPAGPYWFGTLVVEETPPRVQAAPPIPRQTAGAR